MNDLETTLVESLRARAEAIEPANLLYPAWLGAAAPAASHDGDQRRTRRWLMPAVAAVAVVLAVVGTVTWTTWATGHRGTVGSGAPGGDAGYIGYRWRLVQITHNDVVTDVPSSIDATIRFADDHSILIDDTVNVSSGPFTPVRGGFRLGNLATTLVGYGGQDPVRQAVIDGLAALARPGTVTASVSSSAGTTQLRLTPPPAGFSLLLDQDGLAHPSPTARGTNPITSAGPSVGGAGFIGYRWRLVQITHNDVVTDVPSSIYAWTAFSADHSITVFDTTNFEAGPFTLVPGGYRIGDLGTTLALYGGDDQLRHAVIDDLVVLGRRGTVAASVSHLWRARPSCD
ncbi:MAG TPA: hypothetical protein VJ851_03050 [Jatrophihabitans sp.]|nr:hypothetical protein [Jatrophihabitans sp.]